MSEKLKPCPFCGGDAELDSQQAYRPLSGAPAVGTRVVIYCVQCSAEIGTCHEDVPNIRSEEVVEQWNRRASLIGAATIDTADKSGDWVLLWAEGMKPTPFYWSERLRMWVQSDDVSPVHWSGAADDFGPTHWAPLATSADFKARAA